jgi:hypothetical protein
VAFGPCLQGGEGYNAKASIAIDGRPKFKTQVLLAEVVVLIPVAGRPIPLPKLLEPPREPRPGLPCNSRHRILHPARYQSVAARAPLPGPPLGNFDPEAPHRGFGEVAVSNGGAFLLALCEKTKYSARLSVSPSATCAAMPAQWLIRARTAHAEGAGWFSGPTR